MTQGLADGFARRRLPYLWVLSRLAVTKNLPSGLNAMLSASFRGSPMALPVAASHTRAVLSKLAVTTNFPSGLNAALKTSPSWRRDSPIACPSPPPIPVRSCPNLR